jgi:hypothetical protein
MNAAWLKVRRNQVLLVILVLVVGAGAFFVLGNGSGGTVAVPPVVGANPTATPSPSPSHSKAHVTKTLVFNGRDPFQCIVCPPEPTPSPSPSASPNAGANANTNTNHAVVSTVQVGGRTVSLVGVYEKRGAMKARVRVDGISYSIRVGKSFGSNFKLASISGSCARLLYGDTAFTLCA